MLTKEELQLLQEMMTTVVLESEERTKNGLTAAIQESEERTKRELKAKNIKIIVL